MAGNRKSGGANVALTTRKRRSGGAWTDLTIARRRSGGAWIDLFGLVSITNQTIHDVQPSPTDASATYTVSSGGTVQGSPGGFLETWLLSGPASNYDVRVTVTSGTLTSGTTGTWLNLAASQSWNLTRAANTNGALTVVMTVEIRETASGTVLDSATVTLIAEVIL